MDTNEKIKIVGTNIQEKANLIWNVANSLFGAYIDVSKGKSTVCGMKPGGEIVYTPFEVQHTMEGDVGARIAAAQQR